jgi:hypothetical protein
VSPDQRRQKLDELRSLLWEDDAYVAPAEVVALAERRVAPAVSSKAESDLSRAA